MASSFQSNFRPFRLGVVFEMGLPQWIEQRQTHPTEFVLQDDAVSHLLIQSEGTQMHIRQ